MSLKYEPKSMSLKYEPRSMSLEYEPRSMSLKYEPKSMSLKYEPRSMSLKYEPKSMSLKYEPSSEPQEDLAGAIGAATLAIPLSVVLQRATVRGRAWYKRLDAPALTLDVTPRRRTWQGRSGRQRSRSPSGARSSPLASRSCDRTT